MRQIFTMAAIAAALTVIPVTTALARTPSDGLNEAETVDNPAAENQVSTWCVQGVKFDNLTGQTFTIPEPPDDSTWTKLILNGGQDGAPENNVRSYIVESVPAVGVVVTRPGAAVSNAILCYEPASEPEPTPAPTPAPTPGDEVSAAGPVPPVAAPSAGAPSVAASPAAAAPSVAASSAAASPAAAAPTQLPSTGASSWGLALAALASLVGGLSLVKLSRRTS